MRPGSGSFNSGGGGGFNAASGGRSSGSGSVGSSSGTGWDFANRGSFAGGYYQPNNSMGYGGQLGSSPWTNQVIGGPNGYLEQNHDFAYTKYLGDIGVSDPSRNGGFGYDSPFQSWVRSQQNDTEQGYGAQFARNPLLTYGNGPGSYLDQLGGIDYWRSRWNMQSPGQRGVNYSNFAPRSTWIPN